MKLIIYIPERLTSSLFTNKDGMGSFDCGICLETLNDPVQCKRGHAFCRECIVEALTKCEECPSCREKLTEDTLSDCLFAKQQIASRQVYCFTCVDGGKVLEKKSSSSSSSGGAKKRVKIDACTWTGKLEDAERHFNECPYAGVLCKYAQLADKRMDIQSHEENCHYRLVPCKWCGLELKQNDLPQHHVVCNKREVKCSNGGGHGCRVKVPHDELKLHEATCGWVDVRCPLADTVGCTACIFRKDVEMHLSVAAQQHNQLFMQNIGGLQREISELKSVVMKATHEITLQARVDEILGQKAIIPSNPVFPARIYSEVTNLCGYQASMYVDTIHPEGKNDIGAYLTIAGDPFPCRVAYSIRLVHHDGKPTSRFSAGVSPGGVVFDRGTNTSWGWRSFISKDRITIADSPFVKVIQLPGVEAIPPINPMPVIAVVPGFIDLTDDDDIRLPPIIVPVAVITFVVSFRFLPTD